MTVLEIEKQLQGLNAASVQSIPLLMEMGTRIAGWIAFTGQAQAEAKRALLLAKKTAYHEAMKQLKEQGKEVAPSLVKDYVSTMCADQEANYILCDRVNAACTHTLTFINVCLSCLKEEMKAINYQT